MRNHNGVRRVARVVVLVVGLGLSASGAASAQDEYGDPPEETRRGSTELTLYGGGYLGGTVYAGENGNVARDVQVGDDWTYGARLGYVFNQTVGLELGYGRSASELTVESGGGFQDTPIGEITEDRYELNLNFYMRPGPMRGFFSIGGGATHFGADFDDGSGNARSASDTRFTSNLGLGFQYSANEKVGLRIDGRWRYTDTNTGGSDYYCDIYGFCYQYDNSSYTSAEITAGLTYTIR